MPKYQPGGKKDRQYGVLEEIRPDHLKRYQFAAQNIPPRSRVADIACGCGYGSWILHSHGHEVTGVDISRDAIDYAKKHYPGPLYVESGAQDFGGEFDALVTFETLEHISDPAVVLGSTKASLVIASVPNQEWYPFQAENFAGDDYPHLRHYTPAEFDGLLEASGLAVTERYCQKDKKTGDVFPGTDGRFLIYIARKIR